MLTHDREKKAWNWKKYVAHHVKYHIILGNLMEYGYQGLHPGSKIQYLFNVIRCYKLSTAVTTVRVHPDKYEKEFDAVVAFLTQYIDKRAPTPTAKIASVTQTRPAKQQKTSTNHGTFKGEIELNKHSREEYESMSASQCQQLYELQKKSRLIKGKKTLETKRALEARVAKLEAKTDNSSNKSLFAEENPKADNRNNPALDRKGNGTRQIHADT